MHQLQLVWTRGLEQGPQEGTPLTLKKQLFTKENSPQGPVLKAVAGPVGVGYCFGEAPPAAKILIDFAKEREFLTVRGAILGSNVLDLHGVKGLADLPPREVVLAQLLGVVQGPMGSLVSTIQAPMRELVQVLQARSEQGQQTAA